MDTGLESDLTRVLNDLDTGDRQAVAQLLPAVYADLRRLADSFFHNERQDHTLQPTALVHEAYLRLMKERPGAFENRAHFFRVAAVVMRHILVKHARDRNSIKRGGQFEKIALSDNLLQVANTDVDLVALDEALRKLTTSDPWQSQIVELRFFAGLSVAEVADVLSVSKRTVETDWAMARAWLWREMNR
ncbi:MAG TPA: sigma-70 family RNA polymerase sigma factor [Phycisphaerae bacterium]|nr:sigma-70 family RNA polymerase sigma factor [Phycisphaerae bacterium]